MKNEEITKRLRSASSVMTPVQLAELAGDLTGGGLTQGVIATTFKTAFPGIPLRILLEAGAWERVSDGGMTDEAFNELLHPWLDRSGSDA
jgi:hypothetical protein